MAKSSEKTKKPHIKAEKVKKPAVKKPAVVKESKKPKVSSKEKIKEAPIIPEVVMVRPEELNSEDEKVFQAAAEDAAAGKPERYWEAVGRRKTAIARVRLYTRGDKNITINEKPYGEYFFQPALQRIVEDSLQKMKSMARFRVTIHVFGGGLKAQSEAVRHGLARALVKFNPDFRKRLRRASFLTRDPRMKERKKFGLKGARRAPQWAKR